MNVYWCRAFKEGRSQCRETRDVVLIICINHIILEKCSCSILSFIIKRTENIVVIYANGRSSHALYYCFLNLN